MKKFFTLFAMAALAFSMHADMYIVGSAPFGDWHTNVGELMTDNGDNTYTWQGEIKGTIWFVFASGLTANDGEWDQFNNEFRYGPTTGSDQTVTVGEYVATQLQGNGNGAYKFGASSDGSEYIITIDMDNMEFWIEGETPDPGFKTFTVAGTPAAVFGTEWDPSNVDNDMTLNEDGKWVLDKYSCELQEGNVSFKVVANHDWGNAWPASNYDYYIETPGYYDLHFTFDSTNYEITIVAELGDTIPAVDPRTGDLFILGEINGNGWAPNVGFEMSTQDENIFTADVEATGANTDEGDETLYSYFSFTSKLAEGADDWGSINANRIGALEDGYLVSDDMLGMELGLGGFGSSNSFKVPSGAYTLTVNLDEQTLVITKGGGVQPIPGDVNADGEVNIGDLNAVIAMILSNTFDVTGDVNSDGEVNIGDINEIIAIILSGN